MRSPTLDSGGGDGGRGARSGDSGPERTGAPRWIAGVDIGGTNLRVGLVPFDGGMPGAARQERTEPEKGPAHVAARVADMLRSAIGEVGQG
ncbi:MAG: ROK family protein, partial [Gemmatimonadetes bacterium]|nr:ROK family protein [Gemmatimonadota bacterium]